MKRILALILVAVMLTASLASCGGGNTIVTTPSLTYLYNTSDGERMVINDCHHAACWMNVKKGVENGTIQNSAVSGEEVCENE